MRKNKKKDKKDNWLWQVFIISFISAIIFGTIANNLVVKLNTLFASIVLFIIILIGILFDLIGMSVASCNETPFHAMASKKQKGAREAINLVRNSSRVSNICNDVIGDICGIISGSIGTLLSLNISNLLKIDIIIVSLIISAFIASLTIGGKAIGKKFAAKNCISIIYKTGAVISIFDFKLNKR